MKRLVLATLWFCCYVNGLTQNRNIETAIVCYVSSEASFPGGHKAFVDFVKSKSVYPESAKKDVIEGVVILQFRVDTSGAVSKCKILKSVRRDIDAEAIRILLSSKWVPKMRGERKVDSYMRVPIVFCLK